MKIINTIIDEEGVEKQVEEEVFLTLEDDVYKKEIEEVKKKYKELGKTDEEIEESIKDYKIDVKVRKVLKREYFTFFNKFIDAKKIYKLEKVQGKLPENEKMDQEEMMIECFNDDVKLTDLFVEAYEKFVVGVNGKKYDLEDIVLGEDFNIISREAVQAVFSVGGGLKK